MRSRNLHKNIHTDMRCAGALESFKSRQLEKVLIVSTMGIRGLSTYVSARDRGDLFTEHKLRECQVVLGMKSATIFHIWV